MSKSKLEQLLLEASSFTNKVEKQTKLNEEAVIKTAVKEEVRKFINEATEDVDDDMEFDETTSTDADTDFGTETETGETETGEAEGSEETEDMATNDETSFGSDEESLGDEEMSDDDDALDIGVGMDSEFGANDEQVLDLSDASFDEIVQTLQTLDDNEKIEIVKKPSFQVTKSGSAMDGVNGGMPMTLDAEDDDDTEMEFDLDDEQDEQGEDEAEESMEGGEESEESMEGGEDDEDEDESVEENFKFSKVNNSKGGKNAPYATKGKKVVNETDESDMIDECQDESVYESTVNENKVLKGHLKKMALEIKGYKAREAQAVKQLQESMKKLHKLALTNTNLAYFVKLVNENATSHTEKMNILTKLDAAKTIRESKITFDMLKESLEKRPKGNQLISKNSIEKSGKSKVVAESVTRNIKEEKALISEELQMIDRLMNFKPKS